MINVILQLYLELVLHLKESESCRASLPTSIISPQPTMSLYKETMIFKLRGQITEFTKDQ